MKRAILPLALLFVVVYFAPLGVRPLYSPDEARYAEIPREMLVSGDWIVPHLDGLRYFEKTPLGYWMTAASFLVFGLNGFAARLPSAAAVGLTALILVMLARRWVAGRYAGPLAAAAYLTSILVYVLGTVDTPDALLTLWLTAALACFIHALLLQPGRPQRLFLVLGGVSCGLAVLTKGFLGLAVPVMVLAPGLIVERRWREIPRLAWSPVLAALATMAPWAVWVQLREPDYWRYFIWVEHLARFLDPQAMSLHAEPVWFFLPVLAVGQLAWLPWIPAVISGYRGRAGARSPLIRWAVLWAAIPFAFFSASGGKLPSYILPCVPPLALLVAIGLNGWLEGRRAPSGVTAGAWITVLAAAASLIYVTRIGPAHYAGDETWKWALVLGSLAWWAATGIAVALVSRPGWRLAIGLCGPLVLFGSVPWAVPRSVEERRALGAQIERGAAGITPGEVVVADAITVHAACWVLRRNDLYVLGDPGELSYGSDHPDSRHRSLDADDLAAMIGPGAPRRDVTLMLSRRQYDLTIRDDLERRGLPAPRLVSEKGEVVVAVYAAGDESRE